ncbi:MAG: glycosyltransferase family 4 protein [Chloroflexi bacterium]|nr:glycosyltransferase family 4 protein [Chloroflexota bacterium]
MRIAVDGSAIPRQMAGAGVYTYQLVRALAETAGAHQLTVFARPGLFDELAAQQPRLQVVHIDQSSRVARLAWEQARLPSLLRRHEIDLLHSPHHHTPLATRRPRVVTFHDVTFLVLPERYTTARRLYMATVTRAAARVADTIITPSQTIRRDVIDRLGVPDERVVTIPDAAGPQYVPIEDESVLDRLRQQYQLPNRYILSIGSLEPGKNRGRLIQAYAGLEDAGVDCPLVVAGLPAWRYEGDYEQARRLGQGQVRFLGYVPDGDLPALYSAATLLAFPSLYEGFGLPVLEAMSCGTPVVTANVAATAEIAGDAALLVDPRNVGALAEAMGRLLSDDALRADLRARGLERAKQFSWQRTARETLSVYESVAAKS